MKKRWVKSRAYPYKLTFGDNMILKVVSRDGKEFAIFVCENNENGEISIMDTFKVDNIEETIDDVFGTNERQLTLFLD